MPAEAVAGEKEEVQPKSKVGRYVGIVAAAALLFAATAVALDYWMQKIKAVSYTHLIEDPSRLLLGL